MVHYCVPLMVNLRMCALDERLLLINWHEDSLSGVPDLPQQLLTLSKRREEIDIAYDASVLFPLLFL